MYTIYDTLYLQYLVYAPLRHRHICAQLQLLNALAALARRLVVRIEFVECWP